MQRATNRGVALILSAILPGLGQLYNREFWKGAIFLVAGLVLGWASAALVPPLDELLAGKPPSGLGKLLIILVLLLVCYGWSIVDAYRGATRRVRE